MNTDTESNCRFAQGNTSLSVIPLTLTHIRTQTHSHSCARTHTHTHTHTLKHSHITALYQCYCTHVHRLKQIPVMFWY